MDKTLYKVVNTFDDFGAIVIPKYYAIFTYDNVPNYSEAII